MRRKKEAEWRCAEGSDRLMHVQGVAEIDPFPVLKLTARGTTKKKPYSRSRCRA